MSPRSKSTTRIPESYIIDGEVRTIRLTTGVAPPPRKTPKERPVTRRTMFRQLWDAYAALPVATETNGNGLPLDPHAILVAEYDLPMIASRAWQSLHNRYKSSKDFDIAGYVAADGSSIVAWKLPEGSVEKQRPNNA